MPMSEILRAAMASPFRKAGLAAPDGTLVDLGSLAVTRTGVEQVSCQLHQAVDVPHSTHLSRVAPTTLVRALLKLEKGAKPARSGLGKACLAKWGSR